MTVTMALRWFLVAAVLVSVSVEAEEARESHTTPTASEGHTHRQDKSLSSHPPTVQVQINTALYCTYVVI